MKAIPVLLLLAGCSTTWDPHAPRTVTAPEAGGEVSVSHGHRLQIRLPAAQQGYDWRRREPITMAVMAEDLPNAEGQRFTPVRSGKETLRFELARPNEDDVKRTLTYEVTVP